MCSSDLFPSHDKNREDAKRSNCRWFPTSNGGANRKWFGNLDSVVFWENDGNEIRNLYNENGKLKSRPQNMQYYFKEGLTWSALTSNNLSVRLSISGSIISGAGYGIFPSNVDIFKIISLLNSKVTSTIAKVLSSSLNIDFGVIERIPIIFNINQSIIFHHAFYEMFTNTLAPPTLS